MLLVLAYCDFEGVIGEQWRSLDQPIYQKQVNLHSRFRGVEKLGKNPFGIKDIHTFL